uniref:Large ribosomal subunit protein uL11m n=1 Tax=Globodera rostochiensis TaxID=31243 RepID=A0A914HK60_GLORO
MKTAAVRVQKVAKGKRKLDASKLALDPTLNTLIRSQMASAAPPLGPSLGQRGVNVATFCKDFNNRTSNIKFGATLSVSVHVKPDRTYDIDIKTPTTEWLLHQASGIRRNKQEKDEIVGMLSLKHIYEIAMTKSKDKSLVGVPLKDVCQLIIDRADSMGIKVQKEDLDPEKYKEFLEHRQEVVKGQLEEIAKQEEAKLLRT